MSDSLAKDIAEALRDKPAALRRFAALPPSLKAEYLMRIDEAKRAEISSRRIAGVIEKLSSAEDDDGMPR